MLHVSGQYWPFAACNHVHPGTSSGSECASNPVRVPHMVLAIGLQIVRISVVARQ